MESSWNGIIGDGGRSRGVAGEVSDSGNSGEELTFTSTEQRGVVVSKGKLILEPSKNPKWMDWKIESITPINPPVKPGFLGIYKIEGEKLLFSMVPHMEGKSPAGEAAIRPTEFRIKPVKKEPEIKVIVPRGQEGATQGVCELQVLFTFERVKP